MVIRDDDLTRFAAEGTPALPATTAEGYVERDGARIWHASYGDGPPVLLLHGGLGHSGNWGYQIPALVAADYRVIALDTRGHGRSTRDDRPYSYELLAADALAVLDTLGIARAATVGWSDGACTALILADRHPGRVAGVFFFACNMDPSGTKELDEGDPLIGRCFGRHAADYARLSSTPDAFREFVAAVGRMQATEPNYGADDLARLRVPVAIVQGAGDEFIRREHAEYLARGIPGATLTILPGVTHFAPLQRPDEFNANVLAFLGRVLS